MVREILRKGKFNIKRDMFFKFSNPCFTVLSGTWWSENQNNAIDCGNLATSHINGCSPISLYQLTLKICSIVWF
jgi:hypothetical protein